MLLMSVNTTMLRRCVAVVGIAAALLGGAPAAHAVASKSPPVSLGGNTYRITRDAETPFARATAPLRYEAQVEATKFCAAQGKRMKVVSVDEQKGSVLRGGLSKVTIVFKALEPGDPEFASAAYAAPLEANGEPVDMTARHLGMLEELRAQGILTDAEFEAAQRRVRERTK